MERTKVIMLGLLMAVIGAVAPISLMAWLSWHTAVSDARAHLHEQAERVLDRTHRAINEATQALKSLAPLSVRACSTDHINLMRMLAVNSHALEEIGYFDQQGLLRCTSWGLADKVIRRDPPDFVMPGDVEITTMMLPIITGGESVMAVRYGQHNALIHRGQFTDLMVDKGVQLALGRTGGLVMAQTGTPDPELVQALVAGHRYTGRDESLYAVASRDGWTAMAIGDKDAMLAATRNGQLWMLPVGAFISAFIVLLVLRLSRKRLSPVSELRTAVRKREFVVHYQPIIDMRTCQCVGAEALVRWRRPGGALIRPDLFIPLAEQSGLILPITDLVIQSVVDELGPLLLRQPALHVAVNLCADDVRSGRVLGVVAEAVKASGIRPGQIWLEATERGFMDITSARVTLARAREMGHPTAIDDFGTGYSSLAYLQGLPMDALKIDKSFVSTIGTGSVSSSVIAHIIELAKSLNLLIVAEGVELPEQADYLAARGVHFAQGWLYAKAMPAAEFLDFLARGQARPAGAPAPDTVVMVH